MEILRCTPSARAYGQAVQDILDQIPRSSDYLFPAARNHVRGKPTTVFNGFTAKADLDRAIKRKEEISPVSPWALHDLRRTFATNPAVLGTPIHVTEEPLNHVSGRTISPIAAVYNRHGCMDEMRAAIAAWEGGRLYPCRA